MSNKIVLKKSSVAAKVPLTTDLDYGELALNYADGKLYFKNSSNAISSFASLGSNNTWTGTNQFNGTTIVDNIRYKNSNIQKFSQVYNGGATGQSSSYLDTGEFQPFLTVTPQGSSDNYTIVGRILVQSGSAVQIINFQATLRSNTLPDLSWTCTYDEELSGTSSQLVAPVIWVNETGTGSAQFILALNILSTIYGTITVDVDCNSRYYGNYVAQVFNTVNPSEITSLPANFTSYPFTKNYTSNAGSINYGSTLSVAGVSVPTLTSTSTLTNKTLTAPVISTISNSGTLTLPTGTDTLVGRATTDTLTNKSLTSPSLSGTITLTSTTLLSINGVTGNTGQYLARGPTGLSWSNPPSPALSNLSDVLITSAQPQQVLTFTGSAWINADSNAVVASAVFATSQSDLGYVYDSNVTVSENLGLVSEIAYNIYDLGVLSFTGIISLNNIDQSVKSDYLGYSIIFGF
jgi:hypothetical protein